MKTIAEILGGAQMLLGLSFDPQDCFEEHLTQEQKMFLELLRLVEEHLPFPEYGKSRFGRPSFGIEPFIRAALAKPVFGIEACSDLRKRLKSDPNLRQICGFRKVPSAATFSRRMSFLAGTPLLVCTLNAMVKKYHEGKIVGHISRDSTAIAARERPVNKKKEVILPKSKKAKRGRPRKGESRLEKGLSRIERQPRMKSGKALMELDTSCAWGCKRNSQGNVSFWKGYKAHLDVTDLGIPVTVVVTGANVHDSQVAIPMEKLTERKVTHLYSLMDAAYDAAPIKAYITGKGRVPLIDSNKRRNAGRVGFDPAQQQRFKTRSVVERANSHLKDWLLPSRIFVKGIRKVSFQVHCGVLCLAALKILQYFIHGASTTG